MFDNFDDETVWEDDPWPTKDAHDYRVKPTGSDPVWITGNNDHIPLSMVDDQHLQHIERFLLGRGARDAGVVRQILFTNWYETIRTELELRGLPVLGDHPRAHERQEAKDGARLHRIHDDLYWEGELA